MTVRSLSGPRPRPDLRDVNAKPRDVAGVLPPHDLAAERHLVLHCLRRGDLRQVADLVDVRDFYSPQFATIWGVALECSRHDEDPTFRAVRAWLSDGGKLAEAGGDQLLGELQVEAASTPEAPDLPGAARRIAQLAHRRRVIADMQTAAAEGYGDVGDYGEWLAGWAVRLSAAAADARRGRDVSVEVAAKEASDAAFAAHERAQGGGPIGIPTGLRALDELTGGLHESEVTIVSGMTGRGKSALSNAVALNVALAGYGVVIFMLEDTRDKLVARMACGLGRIDAFALRNGTIDADGLGRFARACEQIAALPIRIDDSKNLTPADIEGRALRAAEEFDRRGTRLGLVIVDYVQLVRGRSLVGERETRERELSEVGQALLHMTERLRCHTIELSQVNDDGAIREAKSLLMHAQNRWDVSRGKRRAKAEQGDPEPATVRIPKQRHGPDGVQAALWFHPQHVLFSDDERA